MESIVEREDPSVDVVTLETPNLNSMLASGSSNLSAEFPSTAELMQKCLAVNPFELKFREANRRISQCSDELLEQNRMAPVTLSLPTAGGITLLKLPSSLAHSPGIFSNINVLSADFDTDNLKSADWSRLVQQVKDSGGLPSQNSRITEDSGQAPRTADVLNAVLDMHSDRLGAFGFLGGVSSSSPLDATLGSILPASSSLSVAVSEAAPMVATAAPSTSTGIGTTREGVSCSPCSSDSISLISGINSPTINTNTPQGVIAMPKAGSDGAQQQMPKKRFSMRAAAASTSVAPVATSPFLNLVNNNAADASRTTSKVQARAVKHWDPCDVKPVIIGSAASDTLASDPNFFNRDETFKQKKTLKSEVATASPESTESPTAHRIPTGSGGARRGRSSLNANAPDERRVTILERNKAAAVRYRKRKKEEHDEMITRVHLLEQEKVALSTQNQVLRRELERITALMKAREACCVCRLSGVSENLRRTESPSLDVHVNSPNVQQH